MKPIYQVEKAIEEAWLKLPKQGRVLLAVSGGVDSMVLLEAAFRQSSKCFQNQRLLVVHVNHCLRGIASDGDEALVLARASELGLEVRSLRLSWENETPSQDACRKKREKFFGSLLKCADDRVLFAHHLNDQAETILFRLIRGTGAKGLKGILPLSGFKMRPFLGLEKHVLLSAAQEWGVRWREDSSNDSLDYGRNWVRSLFPMIEERRPGFQKKLAALAEEAREWTFLEEPGIDSFSLDEEISFSRPQVKTSSAVLKDAFHLTRSHALRLRELLSKSGGKWEAEGVRFTWSAGVLLAERGRGSFSSGLSEAESQNWSSNLGTWKLPKGLFPCARGESAKKEFQQLRVPVFFRNAIPLVADPRGRPVALLPQRIFRLDDVKFSPSPLASWWLRDRA